MKNTESASTDSRGATVRASSALKSIVNIGSERAERPSAQGKAMSAAGSNPVFARASGINVDKMRVTGTAISTSLAAVGIIVYAQAFGFLQMYNAPQMMGFACVAAVLIGGASTARAKISNVLIGTFLFQGLLVVAPPVMNNVFKGTDISDIMRIIISNGIIIYALTKAKGGAANAE